ncbi:hypothetical protein HY572_00245 [Candidatus Micrarchaeota archaeon]|nr:hypothetical protein [Candidatus Micrarchaeota archaeon]
MPTPGQERNQTQTLRNARNILRQARRRLPSELSDQALYRLSSYDRALEALAERAGKFNHPEPEAHAKFLEALDAARQEHAKNTQAFRRARNEALKALASEEAEQLARPRKILGALEPEEDAVREIVATLLAPQFLRGRALHRPMEPVTRQDHVNLVHAVLAVYRVIREPNSPLRGHPIGDKLSKLPEWVYKSMSQAFVHVRAGRAGAAFEDSRQRYPNPYELLKTRKDRQLDDAFKELEGGLGPDAP